MEQASFSARKLSVAILAGLLPVAALIALAAWSIAPYGGPPSTALRAASQIAQAPLAERIVIGDSRIEYAQPTGAGLFIGYSGATLRDLERLAGVVCTLSDVPVVVALGVNDTRPGYIDIGASASSVRAIGEMCEAQNTTFAGIWPPEPGVEPLGGSYDMAAVAQLDAAIADSASQIGARYVPPPPGLTGHTFDGVHFPPDVSERYLAFLSGLPERDDALGSAAQ